MSMGIVRIKKTAQIFLFIFIYYGTCPPTKDGNFYLLGDK